MQGRTHNEPRDAAPGPSGLRTEGGIVIGNLTDKGSQSSRIARRLVAGFDRCLLTAAREARATSVHEVGCGEGRLSRLLASTLGVPVLATDFSRQLITENLTKQDAGVRYEQCSIYDLDPAAHSAGLVLCCEVLEHVDRPEAALNALSRLHAQHVILSVPREPIWRALNMIRCKYVRALGNTPGHLNHWSIRSFSRLLKAHGFQIKRELHPFPWIMVSGFFSK